MKRKAINPVIWWRLAIWNKKTGNSYLYPEKFKTRKEAREAAALCNMRPPYAHMQYTPIRVQESELDR